MPILLANWKLVLFGILLAAVGIQELRVRSVKSDFATYKSAIEKQVAANKLEAAQEASRMAHNATKALDELQVRLTDLSARYKRLRDSRSTPPVPALSDAASLFGSCPGNPSQPDTASRRLGEVEAEIAGVLETGDREIAKYVELWKLQQRNAE
jgi:hypothetical protein